MGKEEGEERFSLAEFLPQFSLFLESSNSNLIFLQQQNNLLSNENESWNPNPVKLSTSSVATATRFSLVPPLKIKVVLSPSKSSKKTLSALSPSVSSSASHSLSRSLHTSIDSLSYTAYYRISRFRQKLLATCSYQRTKRIEKGVDC